MKLRSTAVITVTVVTAFILFDSYFNVGHTHVNGAPVGRSGSIASGGVTCTDCHSGGPNTLQAGWITSTIPASGYIPGHVDTITITAVSAGRSVFGFEASPENSAGVKKGTMALISAATTKTISSGKYITHITAGTTGSTGYHSWSFKWTAPAAGTGTVTFYAALLCADNSNDEDGDITYRSTLVLNENLTTGLSDITSANINVNVYPNPVADYINVNYIITKKSPVDIKLLDLSGKLIAPLLSESKGIGEYHSSLEIPFGVNNGIYFLEISTETGNIIKKILVQR